MDMVRGNEMMRRSPTGIFYQIKAANFLCIYLISRLYTLGRRITI